MYRKWIAALVLLAGMTASAQTTEKKERETDVKEKRQKTTIVVDGDKVIINGKDLKDMSSEEREKWGHIKVNPPVRLKLEGPYRRPLHVWGDAFIKKSDGTPRAFLGVMSEKNEKGAKITSITKESAASKAGLQKDDIITKVNDETITGSEDLFETIRKFKPEDKVSITYLRDGQEKTTSAVLGKTIEMDVMDFNFEDRFGGGFDFDMPQLRELDKLNWNFSRKPRLGIEIQDTEDGKGVQVIEVEDETPAQKAGLQEKDIITSINGKSVTSVDEIKAALKDLKEGDLIKAGITRSGKAQTLDIKIPKKLKTADL